MAKPSGLTGQFVCLPGSVTILQNGAKLLLGRERFADSRLVYPDHRIRPLRGVGYGLSSAIQILKGVHTPWNRLSRHLQLNFHAVCKHAQLFQ